MLKTTNNSTELLQEPLEVLNRGLTTFSFSKRQGCTNINIVGRFHIEPVRESFEFIRKLTEIPPILLLDDIFDKFDSTRVKQIISLVAENRFGQIFITDTNELRLLGILKEIPADHRVFNISQTGQVEQMDK